MFYDPRIERSGLPHDPFYALVAPRPIGWISSISRDGIANLAPYSFFNAVSSAPPFVMFSSNGRKDSQANIEETREFVVNMAVGALAKEVNASSAAAPAGVDEFQLTGLDKAPCRNVGVPRVAASPAALECVLTKVITLTARDGTKARSDVIFGEVVGIHISDDVIVEGIVDVERMQPLSRLGYMDYAITDELFSMSRPAGV